ncbi:Chaperone protein fimC precursor [Providencia rustigianii]|uniref:Chaperone protein fimC n=1 Tax=Providencia rustigianii TaxID=158850 RepID=A0A379G3R3_9GAMM|nr:molecular chaperone [Providencia rustigianii]SUC35670.1 Chaperone protein fimC precursor [Providencia rustigianii]
MKKLTQLIFTIPLLAANFAAHSAGLHLEQTRLIINNANPDTTFTVVNDDSFPYLIQATVTNTIEGEKSSQVEVNPPLFGLDANSKFSPQVLLKEKNKLPSDTESLFFLSTRAIPAHKRSNDRSKNNKQIITMNIIIKVIYRPSHLAVPNNQIFQKVTLSKKDAQWQFDNPTPYYVTLVKIKLNQHDYGNSLILPPLSRMPLSEAPRNITHASWQVVNDYGGLSKVLTYPVSAGNNQ